jgi:hypothetical protein
VSADEGTSHYEPLVTRETLDVERLADAFDIVMAMAPDPHPTGTRWEAIAGMYVRMAPEPTE